MSTGNAELLLASPEHDPQSTHARRLDGLSVWAKHLQPVSRSKHALQGNIVRITRILDPIVALAHGATCGPAPYHGLYPTTHALGPGGGQASPQPFYHTIIERKVYIMTKIGNQGSTPYVQLVAFVAHQ